LFTAGVCPAVFFYGDTTKICGAAKRRHNTFKRYLGIVVPQRYTFPIVVTLPAAGTEMTIDDYLASLKDGRVPSGLSAPLQSLWQEARGDWEAAHKIVQAQDTSDAAWVHAYLHRKEGDAANAGYWYRRAKHPVSDAALEVEWRNIVSALLEAAQTA
jgi:hypothetical protein